MLKFQSILETLRTVDLRAQFSQNRLPLLLAGSAGSLAIAGIWVLGTVTGVNLSDLTR